ncbi:MAG: hypothetical protein R2911_38355 [Caldilineaceae bacterium]
MKPILILAHPGDRLARRVGGWLQSWGGPDCVKLIGVEQIALAPDWRHYQTRQGVTTHIRLADGAILDDRFGAVFNRLQQVELPHFAGAAAADRAYALAEMQALLLSWLHSLPCPVINRASPQGLGGARRTHAQWLHLAHAGGLPVQAYHFSTNPRRFSPPTQVNSPLLSFRSPASTSLGGISQLEPITPLQIGADPTFFVEAVGAERRRVLVAGERVVGAVEGMDVDGCRRLARLAGCALLEIEWARRMAGEDGAWVVCGANSFPVGEDGGFVAAIGDLLVAEAAPSPGPLVSTGGEERGVREKGAGGL